MLKNWGTWLGLDHPNDGVTQQSDSVDGNDTNSHEMNKQPAADGNEQSSVQSPPLVQKAKGFGGKFTLK